MDLRPGLNSLRRLFGGESALLERRVANLPVMEEHRQGPACPNCGFGTLHLVPEGQAQSGMFRCDRPGCGLTVERTRVTTTGWQPAAAG